MDHELSLSRSFFKGHGHGNDYLVFQEGDDWSVTERSVEAVCHRWRGVGGDGIVALLEPPGPPFRLRMFNPDGGEFERSGNGLRILGSFLRSRGWVGLKEPFPVRVGGDEVRMEILEETASGEVDVAVEMGRARMGPEAVGGTAGDEPGGPGTLPGPDGEPLQAQPVSVGNPHCVLFGVELTEAELLRLGPFMTAHPAFPAGANVQLARVPGPGRVEILIWERGVGRTASSGTSACAAAAASVHRGSNAPGPIRVEMEGGDFLVEVSSELEVRLQGPVRPVMEGKLRPEFIRELGASP